MLRHAADAELVLIGSFDAARLDATLTLDGGSDDRADGTEDAALGFDDVVIAVEIHLPLTPALQARLAHGAGRPRGDGPARG